MVVRYAQRKFSKFSVDKTKRLEAACYATYKEGQKLRCGDHNIQKCQYHRTYIERIANKKLVVLIKCILQNASISPK